MKQANRLKAFLPWQSEFDHHFACWANNHRGWAKAKKNNAKVIMLSNGLGPLLREKSKKCVKKVLDCSDYISLRDDNSIRIASELCNKKVNSSYDVAVSGYIPKGKNGEKKYIVIAPKKTDERNTDKLLALLKRLKNA